MLFTSHGCISVMQTAWRERNPSVRIKAAKSALNLNQECVCAYILLAEEECTSILDAEKMFRTGLKYAEISYRKSQALQHQSTAMELLHSKSPIYYWIFLPNDFLETFQIYRQCLLWQDGTPMLSFTSSEGWLCVRESWAR